MRTDRFISRIRQRAGSTQSAARTAAEQTLEVLGELLTRHDRRDLARELPGDLGDRLQVRSPEASFGLETFYEKIHIEPDDLAGEDSGGVHLEHAQAVCEVLTELLDGEWCKRLQSRLPDDYADLFEVRHVSTATPPRGHDIEENPRKLSNGRPGSSQPLSEVSDGAQRESVAESENPRADRKLSSSTGSPTPGRDLASGEPPGESGGE
ncbi:MAG: DUF2267 domain-containing protein [Bradymonadaceae bacterium]